ncbi:MAG: succinyl-diaminopimelate desuccinylase [Pseudomonadota bacterium]
MNVSQTDPVDLTAQLVRCPSVTPVEAGAIALLERTLAAAGFTCCRADRGDVANLFARWGPKAHPRSFGFNGHTDVVPPGDAGAWRFDPFSATEADGRLWGRGAADMKSGVAAFVAAAIDFVKGSPPDGAIVITITGDEEGPARDGTRALLDQMAADGEAMTACLVGEPTCPDLMGDMIKIGRRGSQSVAITATGVQGHAAYPHRAKNPVSAMAQLAAALVATPLDQGTEHFDPSTLAITTIDTGNPATNVIPATCAMTVNVRFNDLHTGESILAHLRDAAAPIATETGVDFDFEPGPTSPAFLTPPGKLSALVAAAVEAETGRVPALSTSGGTSDARFIQAHCPVVEFGLVGQTMHQVDENVQIAHIHQLKAIYGRILQAYFA